jgi:hypothetical protein
MRHALKWVALSGLAAAIAASLLIAAARTTPAGKFEFSAPSQAPVSVPIPDAIGEVRTAPTLEAEAAQDLLTAAPEASPDNAAVSASDSALEASPAPAPAVAFPSGGTTAGQTLDSGVSGLVMFGSVCARPNDPTRCPAPLGATLSVLRAGTGEAVASVPIGQLGRFQIALQPGPYVLRVLVPQQQSGPREATRAITVKPHEFTLEIIRISSTLSR